MGPDASYEAILADNYDAVYDSMRRSSGDIAFYVDLARDLGGPLLELGCGTGRILLPSAALGVDAVGLDASARMLERLRNKKPPDNVELVHAKMEDFALGRRFRLITAPFRAFQHLLDVDSQLAALANVRAHLLPDGAFAFDVFDPKLERTALTEEPEAMAFAFTHEKSKMRRWDTVRRDPSTQIMTVTFRFEGEDPSLEGSTKIEMRWFYRFELEHLLARAGFTRLTFYRDFRKTPWSAGAQTVVVARV